MLVTQRPDPTGLHNQRRRRKRRTDPSHRQGSKDVAVGYY